MWVTVALESHTYGVVSIVTRVRHTCTQYAGTQLFSVFICVHHNCGQFGKRWPSFSTFHFLSITLSWTFTRVAKFRPSSSSLQFPVNRYYLQVHLCACCNSNIYIYACVYTFPREWFSFNSSWPSFLRTKSNEVRFRSVKTRIWNIATIILSAVNVIHIFIHFERVNFHPI